MQMRWVMVSLICTISVNYDQREKLYKNVRSTFKETLSMSNDCRVFVVVGYLFKVFTMDPLQNVSNVNENSS